MLDMCICYACDSSWWLFQVYKYPYMTGSFKYREPLIYPLLNNKISKYTAMWCINPTHNVRLYKCVDYSEAAMLMVNILLSDYNISYWNAGHTCRSRIA